MYTAIYVRTDAPSFQKIFPRTLATILIALRPSVSLPAKSPNPLKPIGAETGYKVRLFELCKQLLTIKGLPDYAARFLKTRMRKLSKDEEMVIPIDETEEDYSLGTLICGDIQGTLAF